MSKRPPSGAALLDVNRPLPLVQLHAAFTNGSNISNYLNVQLFARRRATRNTVTL